MPQNSYSVKPHSVITDSIRKVHLVLTKARQNRFMIFKGKDRRATKRYAVRTTMEYRISGGKPDAAWKTGHTLDMSAGGILADIPEPVPVGSTVEFAIQWPGLYHGKRIIRLFLTGSVARVDDRGIALRIVSHQFGDVFAAVGPRGSERNLAVA